MSPGFSNLSALAFADDLTIVAKNKESADKLVDLVHERFEKIGLKLNAKKSKSIIIENGKLIEDPSFPSESENLFHSIPNLKRKERIRYLGVDYQSEIVLDKVRVLNDLQKDLNTLVTTPLLKHDQKLNIISQFIWPKLIYPLQCALIHLLPDSFLVQINRFIRGSVKEILQIPMDTPDSFFIPQENFEAWV